MDRSFISIAKELKKQVVPQATGCLQRVKSMNSLGKFILNKTTSFPGSLAFQIFLMTTKILFALIKTIKNARDPGDEFVDKKFWETVESLFFVKFKESETN